MLKPNSKKLLLWLYPAASTARRRVPYEEVQLVLSNLTEAGRQSLIRLLEEKQLLLTDQIQGSLRIALSSHGMAQLEADFPALKIKREGWKGDWSMVLFLNSPSSDKNFRYLRSLLISSHCFALKRGVYLRAGSLPDNLLNTLQEAYKKSAVVINFSEWQFGDEQIVIGQKVNLEDTMNIYSGIGREIKKLLTNSVHFNSLTDRQKSSFSSIFDRLFVTLESDHGLIPNYFPEFAGGVELLSELQQGLSSV